MGVIELPGGVTVRTFTPPPDGFDPVSADDRSLVACQRRLNFDPLAASEN